MKLGDSVQCTGYIKKSGNYFRITEAKDSPDKVPTCIYVPAAGEDIQVEDWHGCDRYIVKAANFRGVHVGTTTLCTRLNAEFEQHPYSGEYYRTYCDQPKDFAIVYYADNKKRLVPLDRIEVAG